MAGVFGEVLEEVMEGKKLCPFRQYKYGNNEVYFNESSNVPYDFYDNEEIT